VAAESILFCRHSGHIEAVTPDVSALFQLWSFLFVRKAFELRSKSKTN
jgi:hypothetical protein